MAKTHAGNSSLFDSIVIGGGLSGLVLARRLIDAGHSVLILESRDQLGGTCRHGELAFAEVDFGAKLFVQTSPTTEASNEASAGTSVADSIGATGSLTHAARILTDLLKTNVEFETFEAAPVTYDDGRFKPYVGFGDSSLATVEVIEQFASAQRAMPNLRPYQWVALLEQQLRNHPQCTIQTQATATRIELDTTGEGRSLRHKAHRVQVNGSKTVTASRGIYFTGAAPELLGMMDPALFPAKFRTRALKGELWTSLHLDLIHQEQIADSRALHVLKGANEEPCYGEFLPPRPDGTQVSQWTLLLGRDQADDEEAIGSGLKQIKKQLKRAYESSLDQVAAERILVVPNALGDLTGLLEQANSVAKVDQLWFTSALLTAGHPLIQSICVADRVAQVSTANSALARQEPRELEQSELIQSELASPEAIC